MNYIKLTIQKARERITKKFFKQSQLTVNPIDFGGPRIHLGCGDIDLQGWINLDARKAPHVHITTENLNLEEFADNSVSEIYLCHVLEHFSFREVEELLNSFYKKMHSGATLRISVPDFRALVELYSLSQDLKKIEQPLMGGQDYEYNFHKSVYDDSLLTNLLDKVGFSLISKWLPEEDFGKDIGDWSAGFVEHSSRRYPISLNLKAVK